MTLQSEAIWILVGILLVIGEMLSASFFMLFLGLGAFAAALTASLGGSPFLQGLTAASVAIIGVLALRKPIQKILLKKINLATDLGKEIVIDQGMAPHHQTRITYQGSSWLATNLESEPLKAGDRVVIVGIDGNVLLIRKVN